METERIYQTEKRKVSPLIRQLKNVSVDEFISVLLFQYHCICSVTAFLEKMPLELFKCDQYNYVDLKTIMLVYTYYMIVSI